MGCRRQRPKYRSLVLWVSVARLSSALVSGRPLSAAKEVKRRHHRPRHTPQIGLFCCSSLGNQTCSLHIHLRHRRLHHCMPRTRQSPHYRSLHIGRRRTCHRSSCRLQHLRICYGLTSLSSVRLEYVRRLPAAQPAPLTDYARLLPDLCHSGRCNGTAAAS